MAERARVPEAWIGQEVSLRYVDADAPRSLDCKITEVNDWGVCVAGEKDSFFAWSNVVRIDLGHSRPARGLRAR
jgi:hypothetical protein